MQPPFGVCVCVWVGWLVCIGVKLCMWQSRVEIEHYSVAYFNHFTAFEVL